MRSVLLLAPWLAACAPAVVPDPGPAATLQAYARALTAGDSDAAHALESARAHRGRDRAAQRARLLDAHAELAAVGQAITGGQADVRARVPLEEGPPAVLRLEPDGRWRIEGAFGAPALASPRDTVSALHGALVRRDLRGIEETLARSTRGALEDELGRVAEALEDPDAVHVDLHGDGATVTAPDGTVVELVQEAGVWRVLDVRPGPTD